ncbi:hypothetical protein, partial [Cellulomonas iranensis]|uniref:hypothetical protein n=1 Tax=Cellulomonas iranensis TaxID=76862 RepID=UPI0015C69616
PGAIDGINPAISSHSASDNTASRDTRTVSQQPRRTLKRRALGAHVRPHPAVLPNLKAIAHSAHWRNTWLLAVGTLYREQPQLFDSVLQVMRDVDSEDALSLLAATGPRLATDILDDGVASNGPKHVRLLVAHALEALHGVNLGATRLGAVLADQHDLNLMTRTEIVNSLERATAGRPDQQQAARLVLAELGGKDEVGPLATKARQMMSSLGRDLQQHAGGARLTTFAEALPDGAKAWPKGGWRLPRRAAPRQHHRRRRWQV